MAVADRAGRAAALAVRQLTGGGAVQRKGVKSELSAAEITFGDFVDETQAIDDLRGQVSDELYQAYKPAPVPKGFSDKTGRNKGLGTVDEPVARAKARRLHHWTKTAVDSAKRIYYELELAATVAPSGEEITMGMETNVEPDAFVSGTTAMEMKHISSPAQGAVDTHVKKASQQLQKRRRNKVEKVKIKNWIGGLKIENPENPWPYTPARLLRLERQGGPDPGDIRKTARARIEKYEDTTRIITWKVSSSNPLIGDFEVRL